jgi:hypothetical protein
VAIAAHTARRAYATVAILAAFILTWIFANILAEASGQTAAAIGAVLSPFHIGQGFTYWVFDSRLPEGEALDVANLQGWVWGAVMLGYIAALSAIIFRRYERIPA